MNTASIFTTNISYVDRGAGMPVLLVHGFPLDHTMWAAQFGALADGCRVIAPDLRGFGTTPLASDDESRGVSMERYADDLAELLDALAIREPIVLVGFSMGGYIALQFVRKYADRLRALVLCDTRSAGDTEEGRDGRIKMAEHIAEWGAARVAEMMGPKLLAPQSFSTMPDVVRAVRGMVERTPPAAIAAAQRGMAVRPDMTEFLPTIRVPTLVVVGEHDAISPREEMESIAAAIPGAAFTVIPNAGHMAPMENPTAMNEALVRFVEAVSR